MLAISAKLLQHPVVLSPTCANFMECDIVPLVGVVVVTNDRKRRVGGIKVIMESTVQQRRQRKNGNSVWSAAEIINQCEVDVLQGPHDLPTGKTTLEFVLRVPLSLASTRTTHFDKTSHRLHAAVLDLAPCYDHIDSVIHPRHRLLAAFSSLGGQRRSVPKALSSMPVLSHSATPVVIFRCDTKPEDTAYQWRYASDMGGVGQLDLSVTSQNLVLGGDTYVDLNLTGLSPAMTIHSVSVTLVQTTRSAISPAGDSLPSTSAGIYGGRTEMIDNFELYSHGITWARLAGRARPYRGSYVWRGALASQFTTEALQLDDLPLDRTFDDGFGLSSDLTLPSPIIGALPSTTRVESSLATISHLLVSRIEYSVLGEDALGRPLPVDEAGQLVEGSVRSWSIEKEIEIHSDLSVATAVAAPPYAPPYSSCPPVTLRCDTPPCTSVPSTQVSRSVSIGWTKATMMRHVHTKEKELLAATRRHWAETSGLCACFDVRASCQSIGSCRGGEVGCLYK